jgi:hypothetical protein
MLRQVRHEIVYTDPRKCQKLNAVIYSLPGTECTECYLLLIMLMTGSLKCP